MFSILTNTPFFFFFLMFNKQHKLLGGIFKNQWQQKKFYFYKWFFKSQIYLFLIFNLKFIFHMDISHIRMLPERLWYTFVLRYAIFSRLRKIVSFYRVDKIILNELSFPFLSFFSLVDLTLLDLTWITFLVIKCSVLKLFFFFFRLESLEF